MPIVQAVLSPFTGWLSDRISPRIVSSIGMGITAIGMSLFAFFSNTPDNTFLTINLVFMGIGFSLFSSPNTNAIMCSVDKKDFGTASAILSTMRQLGMMTSTFIATIVITSFVGGVEISYAPIPLLVAGISEAFVISAVLCFIGVFLSLVGVTKDRSNR
jgi:MFS family permease